jgi:hypothetical protein
MLRPLAAHPLGTAIVTWILASSSVAQDIPSGLPGFQSHVAPFFKSNCIRCHGPKKSKGKITLHTLDGDLSAGHELERWELILEMLKSGEMPPEDEEQPGEADRQAVVQWIDAGLREYVKTASSVGAAATTRRLTNFEYQNTMRDLLGFELHLTKNLPEDPNRPYQFNNTAEFMLMGMEQLDRYKENARRAMASAIVDPAPPKIHRTKRSWKATDNQTGLLTDEVPVYRNRRHSPTDGMGLKSWPKTGEFLIRIKTGAILPEGCSEIPLRLVMGYTLNENSSTLQMEPVGTIKLTNSVDHLQVFELRGRIENHPSRPARATNRGRQPESMVITPQNLYDNGRLNDRLDQLAMPRAAIEWIEFEAPIAEVWPPEHHTRILFESPLRKSDPEAYVEAVLKRFMTRAFRRPVRIDEVEGFVEVYKIVSAQLDTFEEAMRETLTMVLLSPHFLYHTVAASGGGSRQYELASRLSYFLWGSMPDQELMELAARGTLGDAEVIDQQVQRLLADDRAKDFVADFTTQWLSIAKTRAVKINTERFPRFLYLVGVGERKGQEVPYRPTIRGWMHAESVGFVGELIRRNASVSNLVDSDFAYLNQPLAAHYGIEGVAGHELRPVAVKPEDHLGGLLTQGAVLIGNATGSVPHPIYRAVWLREAILGDDVKPPPADVPALSDSAGDAVEKAVTIKDLLAQHRQKESCNDCHARLDPWGIPFEHYNAIGRFQRKVPKEGLRVRGFDRRTDQRFADYLAYLKEINTVALDASARVPHGPEVQGMHGLKSHLLADRLHDIARNVLRRLLSYGIGRKLTYRDRYAVETLLKEAENNDYKLRDMILAICKSATFTRLNN